MVYVPVHIEQFISELSCVERDTLDDSVVEFEKMCESNGYEIKGKLRKSIVVYVARVSIPGTNPTEVLIKSIASEEIRLKYIALQDVLVFSNAMYIYAITDRWFVIRAFSAHPVHLAKVASYLLVVDAIAKVHSIDISVMKNVEYIPRRPPLLEQFQRRMSLAKTAVADTTDPGNWLAHLEIIEQNFDSMFPAIIDPDDPVLVHGECIPTNWRLFPQDFGTTCGIYDWDTVSIGSRWRDLALLPADLRHTEEPWELDLDIIPRYASNFGIWDEAGVNRLYNIYCQHAILGALHAGKFPLWASLVIQHYVKELLTLQERPVIV